MARNFRRKTTKVLGYMGKRTCVDGFEDAQNGIGWQDRENGHESLAYERGRQLYAYAPHLGRVKDGAKVRDDAYREFVAAIDDESILK